MRERVLRAGEPDFDVGDDADGRPSRLYAALVWLLRRPVDSAAGLVATGGGKTKIGPVKIGQAISNKGHRYQPEPPAAGKHCCHMEGKLVDSLNKILSAVQKKTMGKSGMEQGSYARKSTIVPP